MTGDGSHISEDELTSIRNIMAIHLRPVQFALRWTGKEKHVPVLCTYLKRGFIYLIACKLTHYDDDYLVNVEVIDRLSVKTRVKRVDDFEDRMRLVMALFTLQRHVVRFASYWSELALPGELMDQEQVAIVAVTGMQTPSNDEN